MTTKVTIKKTNLVNACDLLVGLLDLDNDRTMSYRVTDDEVLHVPVHNGQSLVIEEIEKDLDYPNAPSRGRSFGWALDVLKQGRKVARSGWNGKGIFIEAQIPDSNSKMSSPYFFIDTTGLQTDNEDAPRSRVPWVPSQTDMWSADWQDVT